MGGGGVISACTIAAAAAKSGYRGPIGPITKDTDPYQSNFPVASALLIGEVIGSSFSNSWIVDVPVTPCSGGDTGGGGASGSW